MRQFDLSLAQRHFKRPKWGRGERLRSETIGFFNRHLPDVISAKPPRSVGSAQGRVQGCRGFLTGG